MEVILIILSVSVALRVGWLLYRIMFQDDDFWECVRLSLTPDFFSLILGEYFGDWAKTCKLSIFLLGIGLSGYLTYILLKWLIGLF